MIFMDRRAQLFTLDLLLALVPLTIALGMSANAISGVAAQIYQYAETYSDMRKANDAMDALIKSPGVPVDWELDVSSLQIVGIAAWDSTKGKPISNYIDAWKLYLLNNSDVKPKLDELLGTTNYNLSIYIHNLSAYEIINFSLPSVGSEPPTNATNMVGVERIMLVDNLLQIEGESPEGLNEVSNPGGGRYRDCFQSTLSLTQTEIDNMQFWFYMNFTCKNPNVCPSSMLIAFNDYWGKCSSRCDGDYDTIIEPQDVPISQNFNLNAWTTLEKKDCNKTEREVEYWVENSSDVDYQMWVKVPKEFLVVGTQRIYVDVRGVESFQSGWIARAPTWVTREQLEQYFRSIIPLDDVPCKLVLRMWK